jgi:hypothetical protein
MRRHSHSRMEYIKEERDLKMITKSQIHNVQSLNLRADEYFTVT